MLSCRQKINRYKLWSVDFSEQLYYKFGAVKIVSKYV